MQRKQHTIRESVSVSGIGLHTGASATLTFHPAPANAGRVFHRTDMEGNPAVRADVDNVTDTSRGTTLSENGAKVHTVEHVMAALAGLSIDNVRMDLDGPEPPILDGSAWGYVQALDNAGREEQEENIQIFYLDQPLEYEEPGRGVHLVAMPASEGFRASVMIDFDSPVMRPQHARIENIEAFREEIANSRTFCFVHEIEQLHAAGLIQGGSLENALVFADKGISEAQGENLRALFHQPDLELRPGLLNADGFRHENEPARHKLLDLIGDLALVGVPVSANVIATRPGHKANVELAKKIKARLKQKKLAEKYQKESKKGIVFDINAITEILPHRYPFLLVDKILEFTETTIVGVKNVTINEPFFQGHFPGNPIMPGVLQLEAMAQVGGILLLNSVENPKSVWVYFVAIDNARFKKPVIPGDTLTLQLEMTALRRGICKMSGQAFVDGQLVCSAELVASVVPKK